MTTRALSSSLFLLTFLPFVSYLSLPLSLSVSLLAEAYRLLQKSSVEGDYFQRKTLAMHALEMAHEI
jgi:hypothetical protein